MNIIDITAENIDKEHICCAISNDTDCQVVSKKNWMKNAFKDGLVFKKGNVRGKCFIEYLPAEKAWAPIEADGWMYIDCFWVSGQFKGKGNGSLLFDECVRDCKEKGKKGIVALTSDKKRPFLSDPDFFARKGFVTADTAAPFFVLAVLPFKKDEPFPRFLPEVGKPFEDDGFTLFYTDQCPYNAKYTPLIEAVARLHGAPFKTVHVTSSEQARALPTPFTTYSLFYMGKLVTHEILSEARFAKILDERGFYAE